MRDFAILEQLLQRRRMDAAAIEHTLGLLVAEQTRSGQKLLGGKLKAAIAIRNGGGVIDVDATGNGHEDGHTNGKRSHHAPPKAPTWERVRDYLATQDGHKARITAIKDAVDASYSSVDSVGRVHTGVFKLHKGTITLRAKGLKSAAPSDGKAAAKRVYKPDTKAKYARGAASRWVEAKKYGFTKLPSKAQLEAARAAAGEPIAAEA